MTDHVRRLFSLILLTFALTAVPIQLHAQSLDIGGIDVQLGQPLTTTVLKLRAAYDVNYDEGTKRWFISRKDGNPATYFGNLDVIADRVTRIQKAYNFDNDMYKLSDAYSMALRDSQRLGGTLSKTTLEQARWSSAFSGHGLRAIRARVHAAVHNQRGSHCGGRDYRNAQVANTRRRGL